MSRTATILQSQVFYLKNIFFTEKKSGHVTEGMPGTLFGLAEFDPTNFLKAIVVKNV